jgi:hypothetical protein
MRRCVDARSTGTAGIARRGHVLSQFDRRIPDRGQLRDPLLEQQVGRLNARIAWKYRCIGASCRALSSETRLIPWWCAM